MNDATRYPRSIYRYVMTVRDASGRVITSMTAHGPVADAATARMAVAGRPAVATVACSATGRVVATFDVAAS